MVKNLSCVSCTVWNVFPINSLGGGIHNTYLCIFSEYLISFGIEIELENWPKSEVLEPIVKRVALNTAGFCPAWFFYFNFYKRLSYIGHQQIRWITSFVSTSVGSSGTIHLGRFLIFAIFDTPLPPLSAINKKVKKLTRCRCHQTMWMAGVQVHSRSTVSRLDVVRMVWVVGGHSWNRPRMMLNHMVIGPLIGPRISYWGHRFC